VLVAEGRYQEGTQSMRSTVDLFGGYEAGGWTRDIIRHPTLLSGGGTGRVLLGADDCRLDGFVLEDGVFRGHGGALFCDGVSPVITNNVFRHNRALAAESFPRQTYRRRVRGNDGGAIGLINGADADIRNNLFADNETGIGYGGAIGASHDCLPIIGHNVFWGNRAGVDDHADTRSGNGGAIGLMFSCRPAIMHNLFVANESRALSDAGAVFMEYFCWPEVQNNAFVNNSSADDGGGLDHQKFSYPKLRANLFYGNRAKKSGGGIHMDDSTVEVENNIFAYNHADREGGGIGGTHGWMHTVNNTVVYNTANRDGGGIQLVNVKNPFLRPSMFRNKLIAFNQPDQVQLPGDADTAYNLMQPGGYVPGYYNKSGDPKFRDDGRTLTIHGVRPDPAAFVTTLGVTEPLVPGTLTGRIVRIGDFWSMVRANTANEIALWGPAPPPAATTLEILPTFHLAAGSAAISSGAYPDYPALDIDREPRVFPIIDIGADAYHAAPGNSK
jgi:predicted outer membrane repeat protein